MKEFKLRDMRGRPININEIGSREKFFVIDSKTHHKLGKFTKKDFNKKF